MCGAESISAPGSLNVLCVLEKVGPANVAPSVLLKDCMFKEFKRHNFQLILAKGQ